jgi:hypothetical protein
MAGAYMTPETFSDALYEKNFKINVSLKNILGVYLIKHFGAKNGVSSNF